MPEKSLLPEDVELHEHYSLTTHDVSIVVTPAFLPEKSDINSNIYAFRYTVQISNNGSKALRLMNRHWRVFSGNAQTADIKGEGVVGEQPLLEASEVFEYSSWSVIGDAFGWMEGTYTFLTQDQEFFDVKIPRFFLLYVDSSAIH